MARFLEQSLTVMESSDNKLVNLGALLYADTIVVAAGGWLYWLVISKFTSTSEVGQATAIFSLFTMLSLVTQLGLDYTLLRTSFTSRSKILGTAMIIEMVLTLAAIPVLLIVVNDFYEKSMQRLSGIAVVLLALSPVWFVSRFTLLGISNVRAVLFVDIIGIGIRFVAGYLLVALGLGSFGILLSFLLQQIILSFVTFGLSFRQLGISLANFRSTLQLVKDGLINAPAKLSRMFIIYLSVILLASFGVDESDIGIYYLALMITIIAGGFTTSLSFMVIPVSSMIDQDISSRSLRVGLNLTAPIIACLLIAPEPILSLVGEEYRSGSAVLLILALSILPSAVVMNAISKFNNLQMTKEILLIGLAQIITFLVFFWYLVPMYGSVGSALAILLSSLASCVTTLVFLEHKLLRYIAVSGISIFAGWAIGSLVESITNTTVFILILVSSSVVIGTSIALKNASYSEIRQSLGIMLRRQ